jgi:hypothetical protein
VWKRTIRAMTNFATGISGDPLPAVGPRVNGADADLDRSASLLLASAADMRVAAETPGCASAIAASDRA